MVRSLFSIAVAVLMFYTDEMREQSTLLLLLLGMEKEVKSVESFYPRDRGWQGYCHRDLGRGNKQEATQKSCVWESLYSIPFLTELLSETTEVLICS